MGNRSPFLTCIGCCVVALCWRSVTLESVKAEGDKKAIELAPPDALSQSPAARAHFFARHHPDMGEEHGQLQPQAQEELRQRDAPSAAFTELAPASVSACTSFVDNGVSADEDVSCFPHDQNIGCRSHTVREVKTETVQGCLRECRARDDCSHYTWNKNTKKCYLKKGFPEFYTFNGDMTGPRSCKSYCYSSCVTYKMNPWKTLQMNNRPAQFCHSACWVKRDECWAWSFEDGVCKLFPKGFSAHRATGGDKVITGPRRHCETDTDLRLMELEDGQSPGSCLRADDVGTDTLVLVPPIDCPNVKECHQKCTGNNGCTHYTFNQYHKKCYLKGGKATYVRYRGDMSAERDCVPD